MSQKIEKVAVLGAGIMGAQIAGHLANAGIPSYLFDINDELAKNGVDSLTSLKPAPLYKPKNAELVKPCTYENDIEKIAEVDWVLEAVVERLDIKEKVYNSLLPHLKDTAILSSNTSGIRLADLTASLPDDLKKRFMITHFFNPPRYMQLLELVRGELTTDDTYNTMIEFGESILGKGIVHAKDTPNFIGNRIGVYGMMTTMNLAIQQGLTVEEVDKLTGPITGRPKSATFRTADVVGLDTMRHVSKTTYEKALDDEERDMFKIPEILNQLVDSGRLGQKTKAGFYKKNEDRSIHSVDFKTGEYSPQEKVRFDCFRVAKDRQKLPDKLKALCYGDDRGSKYFWEITAKTLIYSANRIPEISDDIVNIDNAMRWGYAWEMGPFESWDALGVRKSVDRMKTEGKKVPDWVLEMLDSGRETFYTTENGERTYWCPSGKHPVTIEPNPKVLNLAIHKTSGKTLKRDLSASINDLGDGILNVEFHSILQSTLNPIDGSYIEMINLALDLIEKGDYKAMVLGHQGPNFCAGANLNLILEVCKNQMWDELNMAIKVLQDTTQRIRFSKGPVVAAPFQLTLGGGVELIQPAAHRVVAAETYMGLVEVGVGLIPGGGGNLRMILNAMDGGTGRMGAFQKIQKIFEVVGFAKVATSADEAKHLGYLKKDDTIILNRDHLIQTAKDKALELADGYVPPTYRDDLKLPGAGGRTAMSMALKGFKMQGKISDHDLKIGEKLAYVMTGGDKAGLTKTVDEQYILDIEREAFISLCGEKLSQDRISFMLKKGKPLRN
ncbi:MAG: 3-hydroxyacyl-CoA dehydrogenase/enoyl-CoA hydratase family protein [Candidatus Marinimicrobia bacterium]|jgi:3-hydroxyacyl-CoA dehydrogenase|nr:3-hydroxyacyl-CoA dehydrogenase/enoyl-CoA hydratase family protein [Candidatus Neomarinimicrobiota bacterium]MBT3946117.1 3-hydroxyacyl-CoA dehydrogenase/enoyl-CoA hydratase family protein [Candidatus Neomarinimicrobiota bacterium]MBT4155446.1 3-hydroxyacyl-CoA dehydrogenase/enoyl-CoA hydratase family protein [Candidatus Neomarinimicrobiota bacterium]MBT4753432.1 3-hydroxyacyl-CoA dehydrogenase/enoyl-CoA hydratase family protein [Candidatus Neomarinimicrobiota bacterium]MBT5115196.1 3-hydrox